MTTDFDVPTSPVPVARPEHRPCGGPGLLAPRGGTEKLAARVAQQIEQDVLRTGWPVGQVLGSETELRARYQVSRAVLREAIRLVEHHQVAAMRRGPAGGLVVRAPDAGATTSAIVVYLEFVGTTVEHLLAARRMIEPLAVALAAENLTEQGIRRLRGALADELSAGPCRDAGTRSALHLTLAELSGNPALHLFVDVMLRLTWRYAREQLAFLPEDPSHPALTSSDDAHEAIVSAVVAGDAGQARHLASQHLEMLSDFLTSWHPRHRCAAASPWAVALPDPGASSQEQKLAEVVAQRLLAEITSGGWEVGSVIGSEAALLDRFAVSRAVLREAVRLLEYHSVARMRRGPGGGLVVAEPDPTASIEAMALYLDYQGTEIEHLRAVRETVELACVEGVAARVGEPEVASRLRAVLHGATAGNPFVEDSSPEHPGELSHLLHVELAELAANPVLALFLRILITLWARQGRSAATGSEPVTEVGGSVAHAHQGIVDALLLGDAALARHRMRRHLAALTDWWQ